MNKVEQLLSLVRRGVVRRVDLIGDLIHLANEVPAAEVVNSLPPDVLAELTSAVSEAPKSEAEWNQSVFIVGGTYRCSPAEAADAAKVAYRKGVEQLRAYFKSAI